MIAIVDYKAGNLTSVARALKDLGIHDYFDIVVSGDTLEHKKPHPAPLLHAAEFFKVEPASALMVGDSISDVKASRAAGFTIACVPYGYNHGEDIRVAEPDLVMVSRYRQCSCVCVCRLSRR